MAHYHSALSDEIPLFNNTITLEEKENIESLADIYSIIITTDNVEKAYLKDSISNEEYTTYINKLLVQYKTYLSEGNTNLLTQFGDLTAFKDKYDIIAPNAITRLERGIPVTVEHALEPTRDRNSDGDENHSSQTIINTNSGKDIAEATGNFITVMDALKLNYRAKDQLHPLMSELLLSINKVTRSEFKNRSKLVEWIVKINKMKMKDLLSEDEARELLFELDLAYKAFYTLLR
ncbi:hypothetical protein TPHA_0I01980 [Tetrapisispora phaffii CBS 4417]|uniref:Vacuolar protein sorting-associated protein 28 n=1 Tax=Tetrapisispora phaffii (strain ATCC 24235 / CBS 4417 / NBRC 1672 / NRRL Y-8282 / UCD 70-5) TaxID=1071381 RepID=G8BXS4_TETPH|nr:hypothetical protein TPHA_0I01980 [Tetrapisispora phaffii CBS 4417]CCE64702.1 hypothetical protein TPHA_0I01980 [Tetrapisispora phaffii CBS 4417]